MTARSWPNRHPRNAGYNYYTGHGVSMLGIICTCYPMCSLCHVDSGNNTRWRGRALALENGTYARNTVVPEQYGGEAERSAMISNFGGCHRRAGALRMSRYTSRLQELWRSSAATKIHQSAMADDGLEFILDQHQMICGMELFHIAW